MEKSEKSSKNISEINVNTDFIKLDSFLKFCGEAVTGAEAKELVLSGRVKVNDDICVMRGKKLYNNDIVDVNERRYKVVNSAYSGN